MTQLPTQCYFDILSLLRHVNGHAPALRELIDYFSVNSQHHGVNLGQWTLQTMTVPSAIQRVLWTPETDDDNTLTRTAFGLDYLGSVKQNLYSSPENPFSEISPMATIPDIPLQKLSVYLQMDNPGQVSNVPLEKPLSDTGKNSSESTHMKHSGGRANELFAMDNTVIIYGSTPHSAVGGELLGGQSVQPSIMKDTSTPVNSNRPTNSNCHHKPSIRQCWSEMERLYCVNAKTHRCSGRKDLRESCR